MSWLPETDLVTLEDATTVNRGCVLQTHLFHDRILRTDTVVLREGATLGLVHFVLPGSTVGARSTLGPASRHGGGIRPRRHPLAGQPDRGMAFLGAARAASGDAGPHVVRAQRREQTQA